MKHSYLKIGLLTSLLTTSSLGADHDTVFTYFPFEKTITPQPSKFFREAMSVALVYFSDTATIQYKLGRDTNGDLHAYGAYFKYDKNHIQDIAKTFNTVDELNVVFDLDNDPNLTLEVFEQLLSLRPEVINFMGGRFGEIDITKLKENPYFSHLKTINIYEGPNSEAFLKHPELQEKLQIYAVPGGGLFQLKLVAPYLAKCKNLKILALGDQDEPENYELDKDIVARKSLQEFYVSFSAGITPNNFVPFLASPELTKLTISNLTFDSSDEPGIRDFFQHLSNLKKLTYLSLSFAKAPPIFYNQLALYLAQSSLKTFEISYEDLMETFGGWGKIIPPLASIASLRHLNIIGGSYLGKNSDGKSGLTDDAIPLLADLFKANPHIKRLNFMANCLLTDVGYQQLAKAIASLNLSEFNIRRTWTTYGDRQDNISLKRETRYGLFNAFKKQQNITKIGLGGFNFDVIDCLTLLESLKDNQTLAPNGDGGLITIDFYANNVLDSDIPKLIDFLKDDGYPFQNSFGKIVLNLGDDASASLSHEIVRDAFFRIKFYTGPSASTKYYQYGPSYGSTPLASSTIPAQGIKAEQISKSSVSKPQVSWLSNWLSSGRPK